MPEGKGFSQSITTLLESVPQLIFYDPIACESMIMFVPLKYPAAMASLFAETARVLALINPVPKVTVLVDPSAEK
jgi:hypothetical protein